MKIVFAVNHPAQYHLLKNPCIALKERGHKVIFVIKDKDILENLMRSEQVDFIRLTKKHVGHNRVTILAKGLMDLIVQDIKLWNIIRKLNPELLVGTDYSITHVGKLLKIPSIVLNEDDYPINKLFCRLAYPFSDCILSPEVCNVGKYQYKKISYHGYQKLSYLHPEVFSPDPKVAAKYLLPHEKYFLIRLVSFSAGHDIEMNHGGLTNGDIKNLIDILLPHGKVLISSESRIPASFNEFKLQIDFRDIHHLLAFSSLFIADSQSMIVEAAMLGTPSVRFNSFVGKISVLEELEKKYQLTTGIDHSHPEELLNQIGKMVLNPNLKQQYLERRNQMLSEKINVNAFLTWFIGNYPKSRNLLNEFPEYQNNFK